VLRSSVIAHSIQGNRGLARGGGGVGGGFGAKLMNQRFTTRVKLVISRVSEYLEKKRKGEREILFLA